MSNDITMQAVRLALGMHEMQARVASMNVANASKPDARAMRVDFGSLQATLGSIAESGNDVDMAARLRLAAGDLASSTPITTGETILADEQIGDMVTAGVGYQALSEALSRHFGLMRLAISGRS